jgi:hypothetical protein
MRTPGKRQLALVFAQILAAASAACGGSASSPETTSGGDASSPTDAGNPPPADSGAKVDAGEDSGQTVGCGGCGCGGNWYVTVDGGLDAAADSGPSLPSAECEAICSTENQGSTPFCTLVDAATPPLVSCTQECLGRRPEGLRCRASRARSAAGDYFASMAQLEAASVPAFRRVARELSGFGAPKRLVRAAERAAREEISHARAARALARRHGAVDAPFAASAHDARSLEAFAIENAVEGCVRETYGALVATWQARAATSPGVRAHFTRIARDETSHAALAYRIDAWTRARLDRDARARVAAARAAARAELRAAIERDATDPVTARMAGLPAKSVALTLAAELEARVSSD